MKTNNRIKILDCTLRDGGYVINWSFGIENILKIISNLMNANIDFIELGYLRNREGAEINSTSSSDIALFNWYIKDFAYKKTKFVVMIDLDNYSIEELPCADESLIKGIRLTFKKDKLKHAIDIAKKIQKLGYKIFFQPVSVTEYSFKQFKRMINKLDKIHPYCISIVDTYGLLTPEKLQAYIRCVDNLENINCIGYHGHNTNQLVHANILSIMKRKYCHSIIIDSTMMGMGKASGNACTEIVADYLNKQIKLYKVDIIATTIRDVILGYKKEHDWNYSLVSYLSVLCECRTEYIKYLLENKKMDIQDVINILKLIDKKKRTHEFYKVCVDNMCDNYMKKVGKYTWKRKENEGINICG